MKYIILILTIFLSLSVNGQSDHLDKLSRAEISTEQRCAVNDNLSFSLCNFTDKDTVYYGYKNLPPVHGYQDIVHQIDSTIKEFFLWNLNKVAVKSDTLLDIVLEYEYLDGIGGTLARAMFPLCSQDGVQRLEYDNYDIPPGRFIQDSIKVLYGDNIKDIVTTTKHELGHLVGIKHSSNYDDLMYPIYRENADWSKKELFLLDIMFTKNMVYVKKNDNRKILNNFRMSEFFTKCRGIRGHYLHPDLFIALQRIRDYYGEAIYITSSYRDPLCNNKAGGVSRSRHLTGRALDFKFKDPSYVDRFVKDIDNNKYILKILKNSGVTGLGLYSTHIHIDCRNSDNLIIWDNTSNMSNGECVD